MRMVSFDTKLRQQLDNYYKEATPLALTNCQVKEASGSSSFEIIANTKKTAAVKSEKNIPITGGFEFD